MNEGPDLLDWDALIPSTDVATPSESGISSPKTGDYPGNRGALSPLPGIGKHSHTKASRDQSPESPVSPVQKHRTDTEPSAGGCG